MRSPGTVRLRRMYPRLKQKHHSSYRTARFPTPTNIFFFVALIIAVTFWFHKVGFFGPSDLPPLPQPASHHTAPEHEHGAARADRVIFQEDSHANHTNELHIPADNPARHTQQQSHITSMSQRLEIQVDQIDPRQLPPQDQKPDHAPIRKLPDTDLDSRPIEDARGTEEHKYTEDLKPPVAVHPKSLKEVLHFTPATAINFMHFHKTGGVSFKTSIHMFYGKKVKSNGEPVRVRDACYMREGVKDSPSQPTFVLWRCDWEPLREMTEEERNRHDFVFGHQFWGNGVGVLLNKRDLRSFTVLRHPFDRKVSFYYHFFVREQGRKEEDVAFEDIRDFLLYDKLTMKANLGRDLGPNYMAGRLLSDGTRGFVGNNSYGHFAVAQDDKPKVAEKAKELIREYVFVGLQKESSASKCMLRKVVETFNEVNGISSEGVELIDRDAAMLNRGSYSLDAEEIWKRFTEEEKAIFDRKERVDLLIYEEGERLFRNHVKLFGCVDRVLDSKYKQ